MEDSFLNALRHPASSDLVKIALEMEVLPAGAT